MLEIHIVASGNVAYATIMVIAAILCGHKKLIKVIRKWIRGRK